MFTRCRGIALGATACLLSACTVGPDFHTPTPPKTQHYLPTSKLPPTAHSQGKASVNQSQVFLMNRDIPGQWWTLFHSTAINALVERGLANSPNLESAEQKLIEAKKYLDTQFSVLMIPAVDGQLTFERQQTTGAQFGVPGAKGKLFNVYTADLQASYELDLFGKNRRTLESIRAQVDYARYQLIAAYLSLSSNIVMTAISRSEVAAQIKATRQLIKEQKLQLKIVTNQYHVGGTSQSDVYNQQTLLAQTEASLPPLQKQYDADSHELSLLLGEKTSHGHLPNIKLSTLHLPKMLPVSLPSNLVRQRPDIEEAEALMHSASAEIGVVTAQMLPQINLTGEYGSLATQTRRLFDPSSEIWNIAAGLMQPLFHGGALWTARQQEIAAYKAAAYDYQQVVLNAFKEVSDALTAIQSDAVLLQKRNRAEHAALLSLNISRQQYKIQGISYNTLLVAEQQYQKTLIDTITAQAARYKDTTTLFQTLGGGWWNTAYACSNHQKCNNDTIKLSPPKQTQLRDQ